jgi:long-subunit acyl-CoA synthetase (AMP-forming)
MCVCDGSPPDLTPEAIVAQQKQEAFGLQSCRTCLSTGGQLPLEVIEFFQRMDLPLLDCYGQRCASPPPAQRRGCSFR